MRKTKRRSEHQSMLQVHPDAQRSISGATVHLAAVGPARDPEPVRSFGTFTGDVHRLTDWFAQSGIKTVVMESTGAYWIPIYEILEQRVFEVRESALAMPSTSRAAGPTSGMRRGYSVCTSSASCEAASGRRVLSLRCAPISASVSD